MQRNWNPQPLNCQTNTQPFKQIGKEQGVPWSSGNYRVKQSFADVPQDRCSQKFLNSHRKTPAFESPFNKGVQLY